MPLLVPCVAGASRGLVLATAAKQPIGPGDGPGFADSLAAEAFERIGLSVDMVSLTAERALINANAGIEDGVILRTPAMETTYRNLVKVPETMLEVELVGLCLDPEIEVSGPADLAPHAVGVISGWTYLEDWASQARQVTKVKDFGQLMGLLENKRADIVLGEKWQGLWWARQRGLSVRPMGAPIVRFALFMYLHNRHADLVQPVARALRAMKSDGSYRRLFRRHLADLADATGWPAERAAVR